VVVRRDLYEFCGTVIIIGIFGYVCVLHRERYHVTEFGFWYACVAIVGLVTVYAWAWHADTQDRRRRRIEEVRAARERLEREGILLAPPYDHGRDHGSVFTESERATYVPGKIS
jgi:hypothetical protein